MSSENAPIMMSQIVYDIFSGVGLLASIASLILAVIAIKLSYLFKSEADRVNEKTIELLIEIRSDAKAITQGVMDEFKAGNRAMRDLITGNITTDSKDARVQADDLVIKL